MTGALFFLEALRGFTDAGLVGTGAGCGAAPEITGAAGACADVAVGAAVGTAAGIGDSVLIFFCLFSDPLVGRLVNTSFWRRCDGTSLPERHPLNSCQLPRILCLAPAVTDDSK